MGVRTMQSDDGNRAVMYCSTSGWAFGPVFHDDGQHDAVERIESFLAWLPLDARKYNDADLASKYSEWLSQEEAQWRNEAAAKYIYEHDNPNDDSSGS